MTKARRRDFELQSSELWGNKNDLSAQLQIQLSSFETKSVSLFLLKVSTLMFFRFFRVILPRNDRESGAKNGLRAKPYVNVTQHDSQKRAIGFLYEPTHPNINRYKIANGAAAMWTFSL